MAPDPPAISLYSIGFTIFGRGDISEPETSDLSKSYVLAIGKEDNLPRLFVVPLL